MGHMTNITQWGIHMTNTMHLGESHDQHTTFSESSDEYHTCFEHVESHYKHIFCTSLTIYSDNTVSGFVKATGLVGDAKRLPFTHFNGL